MNDYRNTENGRTRVQAPICDRQIMTELSSDFSLPDYQPEIKRLLRVSAVVAPPEKYLGAGNAEFSGTVDYTILYSGNDGALYCAAQTGEYQFSVPMEWTTDFDVGDGVICDIDTIPDMTVGRVVAPRKLSVKCRLRSHIRLYATRVMEENVAGVTSDSIQRLTGSAECARLFVGVGDTLQLGDEILCDTQSDGMRVICADGQVYVTEATAGSGCVNCRGEVCLKLLCTHENSLDVPTQLFRRIPFAQSVLTDGAEVNCECCARGVCNDIQITVEEGRIVCEVSIRLETHAQRNESIHFTRDAYSTLALGEPVYQEYRFPCALHCICGNFSLNTMLSMEEAGMHTGQSVVDLTVMPLNAELENDRGRYVITGRCRCHALLTTDEDSFSAQEFEIPFRYAVEGDERTVCDYDVDLTVISCRARADGERLAVDAELAVNLVTRGDCCFSALQSINFGEEIHRGSASYTICYPSREDTLWTVAKRYHRAVSEIAEKNPISGSPAADSKDSLSGLSYLLV